MEAVCNIDVDLFGNPSGSDRRCGDPRRRHLDVFSVEDDFSEGERFIIAQQIRDLAAFVRGDGDDKKADKLVVEADRFQWCGVRGLDLYCPECRTKYFVRERCRSRICESCLRAYARDFKKQIARVVRDAVKQNRRGYVLAQVTGTVTSRRFGDDLPNRDAIKRFHRESAEFLKQFFGKWKVKRSERSGKLVEPRRPKRKVRDGDDPRYYIGAGWIASLEIGKDNNNLHFHALVYGPYRSVMAMRQTWTKITGDSFGIDIRKKSVKEAVSYVLKYITKPPATDSYRRLAEYTAMVKGTRRLRAGGIFYGRLKRERGDRPPFCCLYCWSRLRLDGMICSCDDPGDRIDLYHAHRHPDDYPDPTRLRANLSFLPRGVTPVTLPN
jgi:hypothetical protein